MNEHKGSIFTITHEVDGLIDHGVIDTFAINSDGSFSLTGLSLVERRTITYTINPGGHYILRIFYPSFTSR